MIERVIGRHGGEAPGPVLLVVGAIHGNEPAGPAACRRVLEHLRLASPRFRGEFVCLVGNTRATAADRRFLERDLNRAWTTERLQGLPGRLARPEPSAEDLEQEALLKAIDGILERARGEVRFLDLHTSSAKGQPFLTVGDTLRNRTFARVFPLPRILGLEEQVDGSLLEYLNNRGVVTLGVEAGQHREESSVERFEAVLWLALVATGQIDGPEAPEIARRRRLLRDASRDVPRNLEVRHRHSISPRDRFRMEPGFANFQPVEEGQLLARDRRREIRAPEDGLILLPLYQGQGNDGFFLAREVGSVSLFVSSVLRRARLGWMLRLLPGVRRHRDRRNVLLVDTRTARYRTLEVAHLFGYRKLRRQGSLLLVSRRRYDLAPPDRF